MLSSALELNHLRLQHRFRAGKHVAPIGILIDAATAGTLDAIRYCAVTEAVLLLRAFPHDS